MAYRCWVPSEGQVGENADSLYIYIYMYIWIKSRVGPFLLVGTRFPEEPVRRNFSRKGPTRDLIFVILNFVLSTLCNCSIAAFHGGFSFSFDQLIAYLLIFFNWCDEVGLFLFLSYEFFLFPRAVIRDIIISRSWRFFFFFPGNCECW